jgi:hypothetical protein
MPDKKQITRAQIRSNIIKKNEWKEGITNYDTLYIPIRRMQILQSTLSRLKKKHFQLSTFD